MSATKHLIGAVTVVLALGAASIPAVAQGDRYDRYGRDQNPPITRIDPGMNITIRTNEPINAARSDYRVFTGVVDRDVRGDNGRLAIPRGSIVELMVKPDRSGEMVLDLESVTVNGRRYAVRTDSEAIGTAGPPRPDIIGSIVGAIRGGEVRGRAVRVPEGTAMTFRIERPLVMGVADEGVDRDGHHYHDWYGRGGRGGDR